MRFTSLFAELLRSRPGALLAAIVLAQALAWLLLAMLFFASAPAGLADFLSRAQTMTMGEGTGMPLAFWIGDAVFRAGGAGAVYVLAQLCVFVSFGAVFAFGRRVMGRRHSALAMLLLASMWVLTFPPLEFGAPVLAMPLWAVAVLQFWRAVFERRGAAMLPLMLAAVLLLYTTVLALPLVAMLAAFMAGTAQGRQAMRSVNFGVAILIFAVLALPLLVWALGAPSLARAATLEAVSPFGMLGTLGLWGATATAGLVIAGPSIVIFANRFGGEGRDPIPVSFIRNPLSRQTRLLLGLLGIVPVAIVVLAQMRFGILAANGLGYLFLPLAVIAQARDTVTIRSATRLRSVWLAVSAAPIVAMLAGFIVMPWAMGAGIGMQAPGRAVGTFFADSFERRTGMPLTAIAGDRRLATLAAMNAPTRPRVVPTEGATLSLEDVARLRAQGGVVLWPASSAAATPPADVLAHFPALVAEVPRSFEFRMQGRQPPLRVGWALIRPAGR